jgi:hypothetical protein
MAPKLSMIDGLDDLGDAGDWFVSDEDRLK